ncbi:MAG: TetR/AcrR family transcriptional regulator [Deltaproteobacteria bacterium]|nr:TetR/AcrR family transcriptional regulator [Deltaproteobacteria bacterium]
MARLSRKDILQDFRSRSLLEATRRIIATEGFDAVTMERVARRAGIAKGGIYLYFRNKDQMILAALEAIASEMLREIETQVDLRVDAWARLCQLVRAQMEAMERHKDILRTLLLVRWQMSDRRERKKWRRLLRYRERHLGRLKAILDEGLKQKVFHPIDTAAAAFYINEMTISTAQRRVMGFSQSSLEGDTQGLMRFIAGLLSDKKSLNRSQENI